MPIIGHNALRVYHRDGAEQTVPDYYVLDPVTDLRIFMHGTTDYSNSPSVAGAATPVAQFR